MTARRVLAAAVATLTMFAAACSSAGTGSSPGTGQAGSGSTSPSATDFSSLPRTRTGITYVTDGDGKQELDLFLPEKNTSQAAPVLVWVHGGRWREGDKDQFSSNEQGMDVFKKALLDRGYAVAAINYRLVPDNRYPDQSQDVAAAIRYLKSHGGELGIDPDRVALGGESAGGHLATLVGLAAASSKTPSRLLGNLPVGGPGADSADAKVDAILGYYGQYDLRTRGKDRAAIGVCGDGSGRSGKDSTEGQFLNADPATAEGTQLAGEASPVEYVSAQSPATMLLAGKQDCSAPYVQAERLRGLLKDAGVAQDYVLLDTTHGASLFYDQSDTNAKVIDFLDAHVTK